MSAEYKRDWIRAWRAANRERSREQYRAQYAANRESRRAQSRAYRAANPEAVRERVRDWVRRNPDYAAEYSQAWLAAHPGYITRWRRDNPDRKRAHVYNRQARELGAAGSATPAALAGRWAMWGDRCWVCAAPATATDHVKPLAKGGAGWPSNLRPICAPCNSRKGDVWPLT